MGKMKGHQLFLFRLRLCEKGSCLSSLTVVDLADWEVFYLLQP